jgi:hypothetical protein
VNNYLTNISARIRVAAPAVRPRLGGHFEPSSVSTENANPLPRIATESSDVDEKGEQIGIEAANPRDVRTRAEQSLEVGPQLDHPTTLAPGVNFETPIAPPVTNVIAEPAPTDREPVQRIAAESLRQITSVEKTPAENVIGVTEKHEASSEIRDKSVTHHWPRPRFEEPADRSGRVQHPKAESIGPTVAPTVNPIIANNDKSIPPGIKPDKPLVELETIVIREQASPDRSRVNAPPAKPTTTPVSSDRIENGDSKTPTVVHSKIAPLKDRKPEPVQTNRRAGHPQATIHVTIGRVEVRAVQASPAQTKARASTPIMNLDDYLKRRSQGNTR